MIGREDELDMVRTFLDKAATGGAALSLSGEAGVGKTVLLDAMRGDVIGRWLSCAAYCRD